MPLAMVLHTQTHCNACESLNYKISLPSIIIDYSSKFTIRYTKQSITKTIFFCSHATNTLQLQLLISIAC